VDEHDRRANEYAQEHGSPRVVCIHAKGRCKARDKPGREITRLSRPSRCPPIVANHTMISAPPDECRIPSLKGPTFAANLLVAKVGQLRIRKGAISALFRSFTTRALYKRAEWSSNQTDSLSGAMKECAMETKASPCIAYLSEDIVPVYGTFFRIRESRPKCGHRSTLVQPNRCANSISAVG
jgi:hypothetical protein